METYYLLLLALSVLVFQVNSQNFSNPVLEKNYNPSVLKFNGTYYMVSENTISRYKIPIYQSNDLQNWELVGHVFSEENYPEWANFELDTFEGPELQYIDGAFNIYYYNFNLQELNGIGVATSASPTGPYRDIGKRLLREIGNVYTPNVVRDADGKNLGNIRSVCKSASVVQLLRTSSIIRVVISSSPD